MFVYCVLRICMHAYTLCDFHRDPLGLEWRALVLTYTVRGSQVASAFGSLSSHWSRAGMKTEKCCRVSESLKTLQGVELESLSASTTTATVCPSLYSRVHFRTAHTRTTPSCQKSKKILLTCANRT